MPFLFTHFHNPQVILLGVIIWYGVLLQDDQGQIVGASDMSSLLLELITIEKTSALGFRRKERETGHHHQKCRVHAAVLVLGLFPQGNLLDLIRAHSFRPLHHLFYKSTKRQLEERKKAAQMGLTEVVVNGDSHKIRYVVEKGLHPPPEIREMCLNIWSFLRSDIHVLRYSMWL